MNFNFITFWQWFFKGSGAKPGYLRYFDRWLIFHICMGIFLSYRATESLDKLSNSVLLPMAGVLVGLSFAWIGNVYALLQTKEIRDLATFHKGGFSEYVYLYQSAILILLVTLSGWGMAGLKIFITPDCFVDSYYQFIVKTVLFTLSSITLRECWHVVMGTQWMLIARTEMVSHNNNQKE